ncbi:MAG: 4Fe-4S binding protein [Clostridiales bacterium]|nr:4Fe-4S binding protein [Clostridiales bacterium]
MSKIQQMGNGAVHSIIFSPTGGTKKAVDTLMENISGGAMVNEIDLCDPETCYEDAVFGSDDLALIAIPSYGGHVPKTALERIAQIDGAGVRAVLVCVYGNRAYDNTLAELLDAAVKAGFRPVAAVAAIAEHSIARQVAAGRPDASDAAVLRDMAGKIMEKISAGNENMPGVPGKVTEKQGMSMGMAPGISGDCVKCGLCVRKCPVGAIDADTLKSDSKKCISCMRCISLCPQNARKLNKVITSLGGVALGTLCKKRRECELFL